MTRRARIARILIGGLAGLVLLAAAVATWLLMTQAGLERTVAMLEGLDVAGIRIDDARGSLAGPLSVGRFRLKTGRVAIDARDVALDHAPLALLFGRVAVDSLRAGSLTVRVAPGEDKAARAEPRFMPRWLAATVADGQIDAASLVTPGRDAIELRDLVFRGSVTHRRLELEHVALDSARAGVDGTLRLVARRPLRLDGEVGWRLHTTPALAGTLRGRGDLGRLDLAARMSEPAAARATATLLDLGPEMRFVARVGAEAFDPAIWIRGVPFGLMALEIDGSGTLRSIEARGQVHAEGLPEAGVRLEASVAPGAGHLDFEMLRAVANGGAMSLEAQGRMDFRPEPAIHLRAQWTGLGWPLAGEAAIRSPSGTLEASGWRQWLFSLGATLVARDVPAMDATAAGAVDATGVTLTAADLESPVGAASGRGYFGFGAERPWRIEAQVRELDLESLRPDLSSRLTFDVSGSGRGVGADSAWAAYLGGLTGTLRDWPVHGTGLVRHQPGRTQFERFAFDVGTARVSANGEIGPRTSFDATVDAEDLSGLVPELGGRIAARLRLREGAAGRAARPALRADVALKGRDISWGEQRAAVASLDADVDLSDRESSWARLRVAGVTVAGQELESARLSLDGRVAEHRVELQVGAGERAVDLLGEGRYANDEYRLRATHISSAAPRLESWSLEAPMQLVVERDRARLEQTCFVMAPRRVCLEGRWSREAGWSAALDTRAFPLESLEVSLPGRATYRGLFDLAVEASAAPGEAWTARALASLHDAWLTYVTPSGRTETLAFGVLELKGESRSDRHRFELTSRGGEALTAEGQLVVERRPGLALRDLPLAGRLSASTRQLALLPLLFPEIDRTGGRLDAQLALTGTIAEPRVSGGVELEDGSLDFYQSNLRLSELQGRVDLLDQGLEFRAAGKAGEGAFRVDGRLRWQDRVLRGDLALDGERLLVADVPELRVEASPDLDFRVDGRDISVTGVVRVPAARIEPRELVGAVTVSADERIVGSGAGEQEARGYGVSTDLRLVLGDRVRLDAFGLSGRLEGSIRARTTPGEVAVASGELSIEEGKYRAYNKRLDVERGRLLFAGGPVGDPGVDLRAKQNLPGYEVGVIVRGRLRQPELSLYSDPALPQSQIASLLLVGRTLDSLQERDRRELGGSTSDLATGGGAILAGQIGRYVGLDEVSLQTDASYAPSLVLGKFLSPRLYVSYGISLTEAINTFKMRYTIGDRWVINAEGGQEFAADVEYTIDR